MGTLSWKVSLVFWMSVFKEDGWKRQSLYIKNVEFFFFLSDYPARKHGRGTRGAAPASDAVARASDHVWVFFFFFFFSQIRADSARFAPMRLDSCRIGFDWRRIGLIRPKSVRIGHIGTYRPAADTADTAETGRKRPKSALSMAVKSETCILLSFFVNQGLVCVFKKYFNSKNIYKI